MLPSKSSNNELCKAKAEVKKAKDVDVDVMYGRRRMPLCPPPQYNTSK